MRGFTFGSRARAASGKPRSRVALRPAAPGAFVVPHATPTKEMLVSFLVLLYNAGLHQLEGADADDESALRRAFKRMDNRDLLAAICEALQKAARDSGARPVVVFDDFHEATTTSVRAVKQIAGVATLVCCSVDSRPAQKMWLFGCTRFDVPRLSSTDTETLALKLLDDYDSIEARERPRLVRQIVEQAQGVPAIARELVKRAAARGDLSLSAVRREDLHGAKPLDMTPGLLVLGILVFGWRVAMRPLHDADMTVIFGFSGAALMIIRLFAFRMTSRSGRR